MFPYSEQVQDIEHYGASVGDDLGAKWTTVFPRLVRARTNLFSQPNYARSNRGARTDQGRAQLFQLCLFIMEHARLISIAKLNTK